MDVLQQIDELVDKYEERLVSDVIRFIGIDSVQSDPLPGAPFGKGAKEILDTAKKIADSEGFYTKDYEVGVLSIALDDGEPDLGIWAHGDTVPAGDGWFYGPFNGTVVDRCIVGRGATDNKGQLSAVLNTLRIFKELGIKLKYNPALYIGTNEENGMADLKGDPNIPGAKGFVNVCTPPRLNLVPDSSYPVGYGARGLTRFFIKSKKPLRDFILTAGLDDNPGNATAVFDGVDIPDELPDCTVEKSEKTVVTAFSLPQHTTRPDAKGNMITMLSSALIGIDSICDEDKKILKFFKDISLDVQGDIFDINVKPEIMTPTVVYAKAITFCDGYPTLEIRVRYPIDITYDELYKRIESTCDKNGFTVTSIKGHEPYINEKDIPVVEELTKIANEMNGTNKEPYINGSTYAHYLPNAYIFGMQAGCAPQSFPEGHGGAHAVNESVSIDRLKLGMKVYARALLKLNDIKW